MKLDTKKIIRSVSSLSKQGLLWGALLAAVIAVLMLTFADSMYFSLLGGIVVVLTASVLGAAVGAFLGASVAVEEISDEF